MIAIIDSGGANINSIIFAFARLGAVAKLTADPAEIRSASHVILPGVGAAGTAMSQLKKYALLETIRSLTQPVLGICLGMQLLYEYSAEGEVDCLGIIPGRVKKLTAQAEVRVPHMGWNTLQIISDSALLKNITSEAYCYFVHSFIAPVTAQTAAKLTYGEEFAAVVQHNNFFGVQFHPERSGAVGAIMLKNFLNLG